MMHLMTRYSSNVQQVKGSGGMKAGRELDYQIHENVMGLIQPQFHVIESQVPHFSTNIADAWLVVEKLREQATVDLMDDDGKGWQVSILKKYHSTYTIVEAETTPLAICLAALKAVGVEV